MMWGNVFPYFAFYLAMRGGISTLSSSLRPWRCRGSLFPHFIRSKEKRISEKSFILLVNDMKRLSSFFLCAISTHFAAQRRISRRLTLLSFLRVCCWSLTFHSNGIRFSTEIPKWSGRNCSGLSIFMLSSWKVKSCFLPEPLSSGIGKAFRIAANCDKQLVVNILS